MTKATFLFILVLATPPHVLSDSIDVFPLAIGNTFQYEFDISEVSSNFGWVEGTRDSGLLRSVLTGVVVLDSSGVWSIQEERMGTRWEWSSGGHDSVYTFADTAYHELIESTHRYHEIHSDSEIWEFPVSFPGFSYPISRYADSVEVGLTISVGECMCCVNSSSDSLWFKADSGLTRRSYRRCVDNDEIYSYSIKSFTLLDRMLTSVEEKPTLPKRTTLHQNYPNPFNPSTTIRFEMPGAGKVSLKVFNLLGEEVATLISGDRDAGTHTVQWDAKDQPSGVYFYRLRAGEFVETRKLVLVR